MVQNSFSYGNVDPNTLRVLEETAAVLQDVDQRITQLKVGLSQAAPHLAPILLAKELGFQRPGIPPMGFGAWGQQQPWGPQMGSPFGQFGQQGIPGVTNPFTGFGSPFRPY
jgi:hypothetical protein